MERLYTSGEYLEKHPNWHVEDSPWKAKQIMRMIKQNNLELKTICEVGCGAGEILKQLQENMESYPLFWGYEISPQAFELCQSKKNTNLHFKLGDILQEKDISFDIILLIDVIEHLEDYFSFLREIKPKSHYKMLHIPLELTIYGVLSHRLNRSRSTVGHLHYFTKDLALQMLEDLGYEIIDYFYTPAHIELPSKQITRKLLKPLRKLFFAIHRDLAVRILDGWSLLVLVK